MKYLVALVAVLAVLFCFPVDDADAGGFGRGVSVRAPGVRVNVGNNNRGFFNRALGFDRRFQRRFNRNFGVNNFGVNNFGFGCNTGFRNSSFGFSNGFNGGFGHGFNTGFSNFSGFNVVPQVLEVEVFETIPQCICFD